MLTDLRQAWRLIVRQPLFTAIVSLTLAVGVGANVATFSIVDAALFRPLPYADADRLVQVYRVARTRDGGTTSVLIEGPEVDVVRSASDVFEGVEVFGWPASKALAAGTGVNPLVGSFSVGLPAFLGIRPQLGRAFTPDDLAALDAVVLSDGYWQRAFGRDPAVIGRHIAFTDRTCTVVGVMPPTFRYLVGAQADAWLPIGNHGGHDLVARVRPGVSIPQAERALEAATSRRSPSGRATAFEIAPADWNRAQHDTRVMLLSVMAAVGFVLLIACANVANLLLARAVDRQREIAVRRALGASPAQLVRQLLIEGLALSAVGGAIATLAGWWTVSALPSVLPAKMAQSLLGASLPQFDARVGLGALGATLLTGLWCGLVPSIRLTRAAVTPAFGQRVAGLSRPQRRLRDAFQALQIALTVVLLVGAGLMLASMFRMLSVPSGFEADHLWHLTWSIQPAIPSSAFAPPVDAIDPMVSRLAGLPGVRGVAIGPAPVAPSRTSFRLASDDAPVVAIIPRVGQYFVDRTYFDVSGIVLREGRTFDATELNANAHVMLVSESVATRLWPGRPAAGRRVLLFTSQTPYTVIGVTPQLRTIEFTRQDVQVFFPATASANATRDLVVRIAGDAGGTADAVRAAVGATVPGAAVSQIGPVDQLFDQFDPFGTPRFYTTMLSVMAAIGLLTAAVGLYGSIAHGVARRTHELGIRRALGAGPAAIRRLIWTEALTPMVFGLGVGLIAAAWLSAFAASQLFDVTPHDGTTYAVVTAILCATFAVAVHGPVRRAIRVDPAEALRVE